MTELYQIIRFGFTFYNTQESSILGRVKLGKFKQTYAGHIDWQGVVLMSKPFNVLIHLNVNILLIMI